MTAMRLLQVLLITCICNLSFGKVELNPIFMDHMVLQRDIPAKVYGTADKEKSVQVSIAGQTVTAKVKNGEWTAEFEPIQAGGPFRLKVEGENSIQLNDVLLGDVWLCTGQSNMAGMVKSYVGFNNGMFEEFRNVPGDYSNDRIRLMTVASVAVDEPQTEIEVQQAWVACDPESALDFSVTGYFFGKYLQPEAGVPIGLIKSAIGGTSVSSWTDLDVMRENPVAKRVYLDPHEKDVASWPTNKARWQERLNEWKEKRAAGKKVGREPQVPNGPEHPKRPAAYFNGMLHPLQEFAIKGAIWYQGENEANRQLGEEYKTTFPLMIESWRDAWGQGDFPFIFVQLAAFRTVEEVPHDAPWARLRDAQNHTLVSTSNTGMAVAIDAGLTTNIHPPYKELVGKRLAAQALSVAYGKEGITSGPLYSSVKFGKGKASLEFDQSGKGLVAKTLTLDPYGESPYKLSSKKLEGFTIAGIDKVFVKAEARVTGKDTVEVFSPEVNKPVAVRYAWAAFPLCNLYNKDGFAASPFRTDDWPVEN
jgi:sialate O-acetylesterase